MYDYSNIYEPAEDSFLLTQTVLEYLIKLNKNNLNICEIGVGSGYVISNIAKINKENSYFGVDINPDAIKTTKQRFQEIKQKINLKQGSFFEPFLDKKFDLIFFNTPYLPVEDGEKFEDLTLKDKAIYGGKKGYEVIFDFLYRLNDNLDNDGVCFMLFSSYSNLKKIQRELDKLAFKFELVKEESHFFESLYILKIEKKQILKDFSNNNIKNIKYFSAGKHSKVYQGYFEENQVIIKLGEENVILKEALFLDKLKDKNYVPKFYLKGKNFIVLEKLEGLLPKDIFLNLQKEEILDFLQKCLDICFDLDKNLIQKFELTNPYKHIFYTNRLDVKFIDFERSIFCDNPKNSRQFLQFIVRNQKNLKLKNINLDVVKIRNLQKSLKTNLEKININELIY